MWTPAQVATALWLDASDSATITASSGLVSQWNDKSGNSNNFTATGASRPTTGTRTINSLNTLDFNGTTAFLSSGSTFMTGTTSAMAVFAFQLDQDPPSESIGAVLGGWGSAGQGEHMPYSDGIIYTSFGSNTRYTAGNPTPSMAANVCVMSIVSASGLWQLYVNGSLLYNSSTNTYSGNTGSIGSSGRFFVDARIAEIVIVTNSTSTNTRELLEGYMAGSTRWSAQSGLPANHPYKSAAP
jgi:hypothetical protein